MNFHFWKALTMANTAMMLSALCALIGWWAVLAFALILAGCFVMTGWL